MSAAPCLFQCLISHPLCLYLLACGYYPSFISFAVCWLLLSLLTRMWVLLLIHPIVCWPPSHPVSIQQLVSAAPHLSCSLSSDPSHAFTLSACKCHPHLFCLLFADLFLFTRMWVPVLNCHICCPLSHSISAYQDVSVSPHSSLSADLITLSLLARMWVQLLIHLTVCWHHSHSVSACQGVSAAC